jgi:hypothetical protein
MDIDELSVTLLKYVKKLMTIFSTSNNVRGYETVYAKT